MNGWGFNMPTRQPQRFEDQYHCYSMAYADKAHLEGGDKILLPPSAFDTLARLNVDYPMLFQLSSSTKGTMTHSGVLEFTAEEGSCFIPFWMMQNLLIEEGSVISVRNVSLPKATFVKLQPQHVDFLEITNPRAVLEHSLRNFSCVTKGDVICLPYNNKNYHFELKEVRPQDAACIIETDCNVDFDAPVGYKDPATTATAGNQQQQDTKSDDQKLSSATTNGVAAQGSDAEKESPSTSRFSIVNGEIIENNSNKTSSLSTNFMATKTGATGVQANAAIPIKAPEASYWVTNAGGGARVDGKTAQPVKDKDGNVIDANSIKKDPSPQDESTTPNQAMTASKRKSRVGNKFSTRKGRGVAFEGKGNNL